MATTSALLTNNAASTLASSITNVATSMTVAAGEGARFPNPGASEYFYVTLSNSTGSTIEIVKCTARATDVLTIVRGQDGTTGVAFNAGDIVELRPIAELFREKLDKIGANWKVFYTNGSGVITELALGAADTFLKSAGASAAPTFAASGYPPGHIFGLTMSNAADTLNDITVAAGSTRSEGDTANLVLAAAITKQLDAAWAVGTNAGGLNTGAEAVSTWYEVHLIRRSDTGVVDVMFTTTANRATLPANYDSQRRIGWIRNGAAGSILQFTQVEDYFTWTTQVQDGNFTSTATRAALTMTAAPSSVARFRASAQGDVTGAAGEAAVVFLEAVEGVVTPSITTGIVSIMSGETGTTALENNTGHFELRVSSTSTIEHDASNAKAFIDISTFGYIDTRGRHA